MDGCIKLKVSPQIFNGRKTDQCGVILFGSDKTRNIVNKRMKDGYERVEEYISIAQPNAATLAKLDALVPSDEPGDGKLRPPSNHTLSLPAPSSGRRNCRCRNSRRAFGLETDMDPENDADNRWR